MDTGTHHHRPPIKIIIKKIFGISSNYDATEQSTNNTLKSFKKQTRIFDLNIAAALDSIVKSLWLLWGIA